MNKEMIKASDIKKELKETETIKELLKEYKKIANNKTIEIRTKKIKAYYIYLYIYYYII